MLAMRRLMYLLKQLVLTLALATAASTGDFDAMHAIFGPAGAEIENPDRVQAANDVRAFSIAINQRKRIAHTSDSQRVLEVGPDFRFLQQSGSSGQRVARLFPVCRSRSVVECRRQAVDIRREVPGVAMFVTPFRQEVELRPLLVVRNDEQDIRP